MKTFTCTIEAKTDAQIIEELKNIILELSDNMTGGGQDIPCIDLKTDWSCK